MKKGYEANLPFCLLLPLDYLSRKKTAKLLFSNGCTVAVIGNVDFLHDNKKVQVGATAWYLWEPSMSKDIRCVKWFTVEGEEKVKPVGEMKAEDDEYNSVEDSDFEANDE